MWTEIRKHLIATNSTTSKPRLNRFPFAERHKYLGCTTRTPGRLTPCLKKAQRKAQSKAMPLAIALLVGVPLVMPPFPRKAQASKAEPSIAATLRGAGSSAGNPIAMQMAMNVCTGANFSPSADSPVAVGNEPGSIAIGDFNNDGKADIAVPNEISGDVTILLGDGTGGFTNVGSVASGGLNPCCVAVGDFNGDGQQDLAVCNSVSGNVAILLGNGDGTFNTTAIAPIGLGDTSFVGGISVGDFNNDGKLDLAVAEGHRSISILLGDRSGHFSEAAGSPYALGNFPTSIQVGDFNNDGKQDVAEHSLGGFLEIAFEL